MRCPIPSCYWRTRFYPLRDDAGAAAAPAAASVRAQSLPEGSRCATSGGESSASSPRPPAPPRQGLPVLPAASARHRPGRSPALQRPHRGSSLNSLPRLPRWVANPFHRSAARSRAEEPQVPASTHSEGSPSVSGMSRAAQQAYSASVPGEDRLSAALAGAHSATEPRNTSATTGTHPARDPPQAAAEARVAPPPNRFAPLAISALIRRHP